MLEVTFGDPRVKPFVWDRIVTSEVECPWMWVGYTDRGYGRVSDNGRKPYLARYLYENLVGPVPEGMYVEHTCHSLDLQCYGGSRCPHRLCATPAHFELVTHQENLSRRHNPQTLLTHCPYGHPYSAANTHVGRDGGRWCRKCYRAANTGKDRGVRFGRSEGWKELRNPGRLVSYCSKKHPLVGTNAVPAPASDDLLCRICLDHLAHEKGPRRKWHGGQGDDPGEVAGPGEPYMWGDVRVPLGFWSRAVQATNGCWHWRGFIDKNGYGEFSRRGSKMRAHRFIYQRLVGPLTREQHLDHVCHTEDETCYDAVNCLHRRCVNPDHLEPVSIAENNARVKPWHAIKITHCPQNHPYDEANTKWYRGMRYCIACSKSPERQASIQRWHAANPEKRREASRRSAVKNREKRYAATKTWKAERKACRVANAIPSKFQQKVLDAVAEEFRGRRCVTLDLPVFSLRVTGSDFNKSNTTRALHWLVDNDWLRGVPEAGLFAGRRLLEAGEPLPGALGGQEDAVS